MRRRDLLTAGVVAGIGALLPSPSHSYGYYETNRVMRAPPLEVGEFVWQWLILLIDASSSMRQQFEEMTFYDLQIEATARSLMEPCVVDRLIGSRSSRTAVGAILWSARMQQEIAMHWTVIRSKQDIAAIAARLRNTANYLDSDTGVAAAVGFAVEQLMAVYITDASRRILDVTSNGRDNPDGDPAAAAGEAERAGVTINAVVMKGYDGTAEEIYQYFLGNVITKDGIIFKVERERDALEALATACASKFCAEIAYAPLPSRWAGIAASDYRRGR
jgi:hypothetical protein